MLQTQSHSCSWEVGGTRLELSGRAGEEAGLRPRAEPGLGEGVQWTTGRKGNLPGMSSNSSNANNSNGILLIHRMEQSPDPSINLTFAATLLGYKFTPFSNGETKTQRAHNLLEYIQ